MADVADAPPGPTLPAGPEHSAGPKRSAELTTRYLCGFDTRSLPRRQVDVLVVGSGIAGLTVSLLAPEDRSVLVVTKAALSDTGTGFAQGGIAGALGEEDSTGLHFEDTMRAGDGLCDRAAVAVLVTEAKGAIEWLTELGAGFDQLDGSVALAREGGHSMPRIIHAGDTTGFEIQRTLSQAVRGADRIHVLEHRFLVDLLTFDCRCVGALLARIDVPNELEVVFSGAVVLATGGAGRLFTDTTNPAIATGDGLAVAYRAGAKLRDLEFVQFHPTALDTDDSPRFLISETLRGEGAVLVDKGARRFMEDRHPMAELAPRGVVVRSMVEVMEETGSDHVFLDARGIGEEKLKARFPEIYARCKEGGFDLAKDLVPVRPAAHYMVGGIKTDIDGMTSLPGLFASGECSSTGVHGANRLASNSLLEGLVFSRRIAERLAEVPSPRAHDLSHEAERPGRPVDIAALAAEMTRNVGVVRSAEGLRQALTRLRSMGDASVTCHADVRSMEGFNLLTLAELLSTSALMREESRGTHFRKDFPERDDAGFTRRIVHQRGRNPYLEGL